MSSAVTRVTCALLLLGNGALWWHASELRSERDARTHVLTTIDPGPVKVTLRGVSGAGAFVASVPLRRTLLLSVTAGCQACIASSRYLNRIDVSATANNWTVVWVTSAGATHVVESLEVGATTSLVLGDVPHDVYRRFALGAVPQVVAIIDGTVTRVWRGQLDAAKADVIVREIGEPAEPD